MRWVSYLSPSSGSARPGLVVGDRVHGLGGDARLVDLIADRTTVSAAADEARAEPLEVLALDAADLLAPIESPPSVRDFMAFEEHVRNARLDRESLIHPVWYEQPVFYFSNPAAIRRPNAEIEISPGSSRFDYEMEIGAVVGEPGHDLTVAEAGRHIAGYLLFCDWSARDLQAREMKIGLGPAKGKDAATSIGPMLVTPDELEPYRDGNGYRLALTASVNGRQYSSGDWSTIYWSFEEMISFASRGTTVRTGDLIGSGTVGTGCILELSVVHGRDRYPWLRPGDEVRIECEQLGALTARITPGREPEPLR